MALAQPNIVALPRKLLLQIIDAPAHLNSSSSSSSSSSQNVQGFYLFPSDRGNTHVDVATAITFTALLLVFSLMAFFSVYLRRCYMLRHINNQSTPPIPTPSLLLPLPPQGLHPLILQTLPRFTFSSFPLSPSPSPSPSLLLPSSAPAASPMSSMKKKKKMKNECVICLEEFGDEEILLLLPLCGHVFHCQCIHMWLFSHTTCPLCRHSLLPSHHTSCPAAELDAVCSQNPSAQEISVDVEAASQPAVVALQMESVCIECKERESSRLNTALKPKKLGNGELRRSYSMGGCLVMKEEGEGSHSSSFKATNMNMDRNGELRRSSSLVLSDESLLLHHHHPLNIEYSKGEDAKIGRSRSFCLKFMKRSSSDKFMKRRSDDGECPPSSSSSSPKLATSSSVKKRALTRFLSAKEPFYCQPKQEPLP